MKLLDCILYLIVSGLVIFFVGRIYPRAWIDENRFPFAAFKFERDGRIYEKLKIKKWKTRLPDASVIINKIAPGFMVKKRLDETSQDKFKALVKESCVAEATHVLAAIFGLLCMRLWKGTGGRIVSTAYFLFNIPFILIQRYNRPRLKRLITA